MAAVGHTCKQHRGHGPLLSNNLYAINFMEYAVFCRRGFSREFFAA
jgi:hypothetical protein